MSDIVCLELATFLVFSQHLSLPVLTQGTFDSVLFYGFSL